MTQTIKIGDAKTRLSELLSRVEAGEDFIIARGNNPVARLSRLPKSTDIEELLAENRVSRSNMSPVSVEEILEWKQEGRR